MTAEQLIAELDAAKERVRQLEGTLNQVCPKIRIATVMSVPMCGWNPHWGCHKQALDNMGFEDHTITFGAWWDHGVSNAFEDLIERGMQWILTLDYDSMFTAEHVSGLLDRFAKNPHIDALAALQPRRGSEETPLAGLGQHMDHEITFGDEAIPCETAHFGLTLLRADKIAKMPKPWFLHLPDGNGSYKTKARIDPDMYFWNEWRKAGNTLFIDPKVCVGHLQPLVSEMYRDVDGWMKTRHVHFMEWRSRTNRIVQEAAA